VTASDPGSSSSACCAAASASGQRFATAIACARATSSSASSWGAVKCASWIFSSSYVARTVMAPVVIDRHGAELEATGNASGLVVILGGAEQRNAQLVAHDDDMVVIGRDHQPRGQCGLVSADRGLVGAANAAPGAISAAVTINGTPLTSPS